MTYSIQGPQSSRYQRPILGSLGIHATVVILISLALWKQSEEIKIQEASAIARLAQQEQDLVRAEEAAAETFVRESAQQKVLDELSSILADDLDSKTLKALQQTLEDDLESLFLQQETLDEAALDELRLELVDELAANAEALLVDAIIAQIKRYIRQELAPKLVAEMERTLKDKGGTLLQKAINAFIQKHKAHDHAGQIINESLSPIHHALALEIENSIKNDLVPPATDKVLDKFTEEITTYNLDSERLRPLISADIVNAMIEAMLEIERNEELATLRSRVEHNITDNTKLKELQQDIDKHIKVVEELVQDQEKLIQQTQENSKESIQSSETQIEKIKDMYQETAETLHQAETQNTSHHNWKVNKSRWLADLERAVNPNEKAHIQLQLENTEQAVKDQTQAKRHLEEMAASMKTAQEVMQMEIDRRIDVKEIPDANDQDKTLAKQLTAQVQQHIKAISKQSSQAAVEKMNVEDVLGELGDELEAAIELNHKIAKAKEKLMDGRELDNSALTTDMATLLPGRGGVSTHRLKQQRINREAYEDYVEDLKQRSRLNNAYQAPERLAQRATALQRHQEHINASVFVSEDQKKKIAELNTRQKDNGKRQLVKPQFKTLAFGAACMRTKRIRIDGDLDDWGELKHPMTMKWYADDAQSPFSGGIPLYMQWSNEGLYFCYRMNSKHQIVKPSRRAPYSGDVLEIWIDVLNSRDLTMKISQSSHQFLLCPFGFRDSPGSMCEYGRGSRNLLMGKVYVDTDEHLGASRAKQDANGYTVEGFIANKALAKPVLTPGMYLAGNFSINKQSFGGKLATQWSASKAIETQNKPDTWGDIVLLGSDANIRFFTNETANTEPHFICIGDLVSIEVDDKDMNIRSDLRDRVAVTLQSMYSQNQLLVILEETDINSGTFRGTCLSQAAFRQAQDNHLGVVQGDIITAHYTDARAAYGESNRIIKRSIAVPWTVFAHQAPRNKE